MPLPEALMTVEDVARLFRATPKAIWSRVERGTIPGHKVGHRLYFHPAEIQSLLTRPAQARSRRSPDVRRDYRRPAVSARDAGRRGAREGDAPDGLGHD